MTHFTNAEYLSSIGRNRYFYQSLEVFDNNVGS